MDGKPCGHGNGWTDGRTDGRIGQSGRQAAPQDRHPPAQSARVGDAAGRGAAVPKSQCLTPGHLAGAGTQWGREASRVPRVSHGCPTGVPCSCAPQAWHRNGAHGAAWGPLWGGHAAASMGTLLRWTHGRYPPPPRLPSIHPIPSMGRGGGGVHHRPPTPSPRRDPAERRTGAHGQWKCFSVSSYPTHKVLGRGRERRGEVGRGRGGGQTLIRSCGGCWGSWGTSPGGPGGPSAAIGGG